MTAFKPEKYFIRLEPDLGHFKFFGSLTLTGQAADPIDTIELNILELAIWSCRVKVDDRDHPCEFSVSVKQETLRIELPREMSGDITLNIEYASHINDKMAGFYRSSYVEENTQRFIGVTQFQESDARRAFPCMDHPLHKAVFEMELTVPETLQAIANTTISEEVSLGNGKKRIRFEPTPKMSTYLVFFGIGNFDIRQDDIDSRVRTATIPGRSEYSEYGLEFGRQALQFCEQYYRIDYPLSKMDLIAVPDFAFGAMENWGAITFRENLLLHYPDITSKAGKERICEVIAHEIAHQWFGNLVTPSDWRYLWLNESFATYFGFGVVAHYHPQWGIWDQFVNNMTATALARDGLQETFAIEIPGGEHVVINTSTAPIIYNKGGSILRQIEGYIGSDNFRDGLTHYLNQHAYDNADSHHLWEALEEVSQMPVTRLMKSWVEQPGYPLIDVTRQDHQLVLNQRRFTYLDAAFDQNWEIPINIQLFDGNGSTEIRQVLMTAATIEYDLPEDVSAYKLNAGQTGFYRVHYTDAGNLEALGELIRTQKMPAADRWGIQNDLFALVKNGTATMRFYLKFLENYVTEDAYLPLTSIASNLYSAYLLLDDKWRPDMAASGRGIIAGTLDRIGLEPSEAEPHTTAILRDQLIWHAMLYGLSEALEFGAEKFKLVQNGQSIHPDIMRSVMQAGALQGDSDALAWLCRRFETSESEHDRLNALAAMGSFKDPDLLAAAMAYALEKVPDRNKFIPITVMAANPHAAGRIWQWFEDNLNRLETFHPLLYERVIASIAPVGGLHAPDQVRTFFKRYVQENPQFKEVVALSLEKLAINLTMRQRNQELGSA